MGKGFEGVTQKWNKPTPGNMRGKVGSMIFYFGRNCQFFLRKCTEKTIKAQVRDQNKIEAELMCVHIKTKRT